jgi:hypothetical protein
MKRVLYLLAFLLLFLVFFVSCVQREPECNGKRCYTPTGTKGEVTAPPTETYTPMPTPTPIFMVRNSFSDFFINTDGLWNAVNDLGEPAYSYEDCPEKLNLEPFNIQTHQDDPSLKLNEIRFKNDYISQYKYVGVVRNTEENDTVFWIDLQNIKLENTHCGKIGTCDVDLFIGVGNPDRDFNPDDFDEDAPISYKSGYGLFFVFRDFHDYTTRQVINRVCLLRSLDEPCSNPLGEKDTQFENHLFDYQWRVKISKHGQRFTYELFYCSDETCSNNSDYKPVILNLESKEIVLDDSEFIIGYHVKTTGYIYAELSGPISIPMTIPTSQP